MKTDRQTALAGPSPVASRKAGQDCYLETERIPVDLYFDRVEAELEAGRRVWISGALFGTLSNQQGRKRQGRSWLTLSPRVVAEPHWVYRVRDVAASALALVALSPLLAIIAVLVKLSSPGPVFYATQVIGRNGRAFTWYKFRSMQTLAKEDDERERRTRYRAFYEGTGQSGGMIKVINMDRVTPIGGILRKYSLDELPQLLNVLKGQMSLVGPRPCLPYEAELFPQWARRRFEVRPGLTGVWQVYGRSRVGFEEALAMDVYYVYARSFWLDLKLILQTVMVVLKGQGGR